MRRPKIRAEIGSPGSPEAIDISFNQSNNTRNFNRQFKNVPVLNLMTQTDANLSVSGLGF